jgi:DNA end-binding protein Ku
LSAKWDPDKYTDEYRDNLMKVIQAKVKGRKPKLQERERAQSADVVDLMARLRASLEGKGAASGRVRAKATAAGGKRKVAARKRSGHAA